MEWMTSAHRVGYAVVKTLLVVSVLALPRAPLHQHEPSIATVAATIVLCSLAYALLQGSDPGYLTESLVREAMEGDEDDGLLVPTEEERDLDDYIHPHEDELRSPARQAADKAYRLRRIQQIESALRAPASTVQSPSDEDDEDDFDREIDEMQRALEQQPLTQQVDTMPGQSLNSFCTDCSLFPPLRAHHCRACGRCVATFDHHCYLVGTCIGEKNHACFWWFLLFQCVELLLGVLIVTARFQPPPPKSSWTQTNSWPLLVLLLLAILLLFLGSMLAFHTFLAMSAMTTYEFGRGTDKIAYLRGFRECDLPFSRGLIANLVFFCSPHRLRKRSRVADAHTPPDGFKTHQRPRGEHAWRPTLWKPPAPILDRDSDKICENLWENKYYSCC